MLRAILWRKPASQGASQVAGAGPVTDPVSGSEHCSQDFAANANATATAYYALELLRNCDLFGILFGKVRSILVDSRQYLSKRGVELV